MQKVVVPLQVVQDSLYSYSSEQHCTVSEPLPLSKHEVLPVSLGDFAPEEKPNSLNNVVAVEIIPVASISMPPYRPAAKAAVASVFIKQKQFVLEEQVKDVQFSSGPSSSGLLPSSCSPKLNRFAGRMLSSIFFLELCAGTAMLTSVIIQGGLRGLGIDSLRNRHRKVGPVAVFDLSTMANVEIILGLIRQGEVDIIHVAPPCGTATRAREIRVKNGPPPLRSEHYPEGLLTLSGLDAERVASANLVYKHTAMIITE